MIFSGIKSIAIPEGNVKEIHADGNLLWSIPSDGDSEPVGEAVFTADFEDSGNVGFYLFGSSSVTS